MERAQIIGLELRLVDPTGRQREVKLIPLEYPYEPGTHFNITVHTTNGDRTVDSRYGPTGPLV